ncbi:Uncharacterised protein [Lysinibacillus sphaericus]|nr:Uncharacterised protein [Lysinibacillus sphaericus]
MTKEFMTKFDNESAAAVQTYKKAVSQAKERQVMYDVNPAEAIDNAQTALQAAREDIRERYEAELATAISTKRQAVVNASTISPVELKAIEGFRQELNTELILHGGVSAMEMLKDYAPHLSEKQKAAIVSEMIPKLHASGVSPHELKELSSQVGNSQATALRKEVADLSALSLENPTMNIDSVLLAEKNASKTVGTVAPNEQ